MDDEVAGELLALDGEVLTEVNASALFPRQSASGDLANERMRRVEEAPESLRTADQPGVVPERGARVLEGSGRRRGGVEARPIEGGEAGAAAEDEALEQ